MTQKKREPKFGSLFFMTNKLEVITPRDFSS